MNEFELKVNEAELNLVLSTLGQLPYAQVNELMQKLADTLVLAGQRPVRSQLGQRRQYKAPQMRPRMRQNQLRGIQHHGSPGDDIQVQRTWLVANGAAAPPEFLFQTLEIAEKTINYFRIRIFCWRRVFTSFQYM